MFFLLWCYKVRVITFPHELASTAGQKLRQKISFVVLYLRDLMIRERERVRVRDLTEAESFYAFSQHIDNPKTFIVFLDSPEKSALLRRIEGG